jgi:uroporphyrinogen decarboxylase
MIEKIIQKGLRHRKKSESGIPDRMPVHAHFSSFLMNLLDISSKTLFSKPEVFIDSHFKITAYYDLDWPFLNFDFFNIEAEAMGMTLEWPEKGWPEFSPSEVLIKEPNDIEKLRSPDPYRDGRMPFIIEVHKRCLDFGINYFPRICAPYTLATKIRGVSEFLMDIMTRPEFAHRLLSFLTEEVLAPYVAAFKKEDPDCPVVGTDANASLPVCNMKIIKEFAIPYINKLNDMFGKVIGQAYWGEEYLKDPTELMNVKLKANPFVCHILDPDTTKLGPEFIKRFAVEKNVMLLFGIGDIHQRMKDPDSLIELIKKYVIICGKGGKCRLYLQQIPKDCPSELIHRMVQTIHHYGSREYLEGKITEPCQYTPKPSFQEWISKLA